MIWNPRPWPARVFSLAGAWRIPFIWGRTLAQQIKLITAGRPHVGEHGEPFQAAVSAARAFLMSPTRNRVVWADTLIGRGQMPPALARHQTVFRLQEKIAATTLSSTSASSGKTLKEVTTAGTGWHCCLDCMALFPRSNWSLWDYSTASMWRPPAFF